jgi:Fic family protein
MGIVIGTWTDIDWNGSRVRAWVPAPAAELLESVTGRTEQKARRASAALQTRTRELPIGWEPLARLLLRTEGVASSQIEDVRAPLPEIAAAELDPDFAGATAGWVVDNLNVVLQAVASTGSPLTVRALHDWHRALMRGADYLPAGSIGGFRQQVGWVGGATPRVAAHVATPPRLVPAAMRDLLAFVNRRDVEPTIQAALAHAQFELIHPYADGNGRLGRVLVSWLMVRRMGLRVPPPISVLLARDRSSYVGSLTGFRQIGPAHWVRYFTDIVTEAARTTGELLDGVEAVLGEWEQSLGDLRPMAAARDVVRLLAAHPVLSADLAAAELGVSTRTARTALDELHRRGIVQPYEPQRRRRGRPTHLWVAGRLVELVGRWGSAG